MLFFPPAQVLSKRYSNIHAGWLFGRKIATSLASLGVCDVCVMTSSQNVLLAVMELCRRYGSSCLYCLNFSDLSTLLGDSFVLQPWWCFMCMLSLEI